MRIGPAFHTVRKSVDVPALFIDLGPAEFVCINNVRASRLSSQGPLFDHQHAA